MYSTVEDNYKNYNVCSEKETINNYVLNKSDGTTFDDHASSYKWPYTDTSTDGSKLTFEINVVNGDNGAYEGYYSDIDKFSIVWDNYAKSEIDHYYSMAENIEEDSETYKLFMGITEDPNQDSAATGDAPGSSSNYSTGDSVDILSDTTSGAITGDTMSDTLGDTANDTNDDTGAVQSDAPDNDTSKSSDGNSVDEPLNDASKNSTTPINFYDVFKDELDNATNKPTGYVKSNGLQGYSVIRSESTKKRYAYAIFLYMLNHGTSADSENAVATYIKLLYDKACYMSTVATDDYRLNIKYRLIMYDVNHNYRYTKSSFSTDIGASGYNEMTHIPASFSNGVNVGKFNADRISKIVVIVDSVTAAKNSTDGIDKTDVCVRAFKCAVDGATEVGAMTPANVANIMNRFDVTSSEDGMSSTAGKIKDYNISLTYLYQITNSSDESLKDLWINGVATNIKKLSDINKNQLDQKYLEFINTYFSGQ